jgi:serine/threonine-protein kinase RsbW
MLLSIPRSADPAPPMYWRRTFPGSPEQAREVRGFAGPLLACCPVRDDVLLALDELVVNALRHTKSGQDGGYFVVEISWADDVTTVSVIDQGGPAEPAARDADPMDESGRGLRTVSLLAHTWGWYGNDLGRTVSAVFPARGN